MTEDARPRYIPEGACTSCGHHPTPDGACRQRIRVAKNENKPCPCTRHIQENKT